MTTKKMIRQSSTFCIALIGLLFLQGIVEANERPRVRLPSSTEGIYIKINDLVSGGCFLRPQTARSYLAEKLAARDLKVVVEEQVPNVRVVLNFVGKRYYDICSVRMKFDVYYTIEYATKGYIYDGLLFLGGASNELSGANALDTEILSQIDEFIPLLIQMTEHVR